jgi:hypothetical protein
MKIFQILFANINGVQMLKHRVILHIEEHTVQTAGLAAVRKAAPAFAPNDAVFTQITDSNGSGLTPWMLLDAKDATPGSQLEVTDKPDTT